MLSKANIRFIKSLQVKKYRKQEQCFVVEGAKSVLELLGSDFEVLQVIGTSRFLGGLPVRAGVAVEEVTEKELEVLGEFQSNNSGIAIARMKPNREFPVSPQEFVLVLDDIRDPGNLGTIIRTADWYGINKVIASRETADLYNPKVITSTMGSFARVQAFYTSLEGFLDGYQGEIFGAYLDGEDVHRTPFGPGGLIVIGSESHGISAALRAFITRSITIPRYGKAESLNAAMACGIILDNIRRR